MRIESKTQKDGPSRVKGCGQSSGYFALENPGTEHLFCRPTHFLYMVICICFNSLIDDFLNSYTFPGFPAFSGLSWGRLLTKKVYWR